MTNIEEILRAIHNRDFDTDDGKLCEHCLANLIVQIRNYLTTLLPEKKEIAEDMDSDICYSCGAKSSCCDHTHNELIEEIRKRIDEEIK